MLRANKQNVFLIASGLTGVSVVSIITFTTLPVLNKRLTFATFCFSFAVPMLSISIYHVSGGSNQMVEVGGSYAAMFITGVFAALAGISALFFHLNLWAGVSFLSVGLVAVLASMFTIKE